MSALSNTQQHCTALHSSKAGRPPVDTRQEGDQLMSHPVQAAAVSRCRWCGTGHACRSQRHPSPGRMCTAVGCASICTA
jgi:GH24 family phage-related lysozyme (muramidase)